MKYFELRIPQERFAYDFTDEDPEVKQIFSLIGKESGNVSEDVVPAVLPVILWTFKQVHVLSDIKMSDQIQVVPGTTFSIVAVD